MITDRSTARIYLSANRSKESSESSQSLDSLYDRKSFGQLSSLKDEILAPLASTSSHSSSHQRVIIIPLTVDIEFTRNSLQAVLQAGQAGVFDMIPNEKLMISNKAYDTAASYLQVNLDINLPDAGYKLAQFDVEEQKNTMITIDTANQAKVSIGRFNGRSEWTQPISKGNGIFLFVIDGAFEVNNRLLETGDALALSNATDVEMEALSGDAVILLIETGTP